MASATNVVFMDYRIRDVVFLISLTHKVLQQFFFVVLYGLYELLFSSRFVQKFLGFFCSPRDFSHVIEV